MKKLIALTLGILVANVVFAQADSGRTKHTMDELTFFTLNNPDRFLQVDTFINFFHRYEPAQQTLFPYLNLGNTGSAHLPLVFSPSGKIGFDLGYHNWDLYLTTPEEAIYYNPPFPFTMLEYTQGLEGEQLFQATHSQNIKGRYNFGATYNVISSEGHFKNQKTDVDNLHIFGRYRSADRKYNFIGGYMVNDAENMQNGGIDSSYLDEYFNFANKRTIPVNLAEAKSEYNRKNVYLRQSYDIGGNYEYLDKDSVTVSAFYPQFRFLLKSDYITESFDFTAQATDLSFFPEVLISSDSTFDHTKVNSIVNKAGIKYLGVKSRTADSINYRNFTAEAYLQHAAHQIDQQGRFYNLNNIRIEGRIGSNIQINRKLNYELEGALITAGKNLGDNFLRAALSYKDEGFKNIELSLENKITSPAFIYEHYLSNHYYWEKEFNKTTALSFAAAYKVPLVKVNLRYIQHLVSHYLYFDKDVKPAQLEDILVVNQFSAEQLINFGKFYFYNAVMLQMLNREEVLRVPRFISRHTFYYQTVIFRGNLLTQLGAEVNYHNTFQTNDFAPAIGQFYLQDEFEPFTFPVVDLFVNMKVRTARIFFKGTNITKLLPSIERAESIPGYPSYEPSFIFGVNWMLYN